MLAVLQYVNDYWNDPFRPALTSFSCEAVGGSIETAIDASVLFSLASAGFGLHDDIIDKSSKKHFRKTALGLFGAYGALLAGDLLIVKASSLLGGIVQNAQLKAASEVIRAFRVSYTEICEAEFMALSCRQNLDVALETIQNMLWKSAADTEACAKIGALLGNGSGQDVNNLAQIGRRIGFYRRLLDEVRDTLNIEGNLPQRLTNERIPLPILFCFQSQRFSVYQNSGGPQGCNFCS